METENTQARHARLIASGAFDRIAEWERSSTQIRIRRSSGKIVSGRVAGTRMDGLEVFVEYEDDGQRIGKWVDAEEVMAWQERTEME